VTLYCLAILLIMLIAIVFGPFVAPADPYQGSMIRRLRGLGTPNYPLGSDELGRDMLMRLIYGGPLSWFMGIVPVIFAFVIGTTLGVLAGFAGDKTNMAIMRVTDVTTSVRNLDFVDAVRAAGASAFTIVRVHVLGNVLGPIFV
jgi:peptide/nickel transport system permease protein